MYLSNETDEILNGKIRSWEQMRDDIVVVSVWLVMLTYALFSNILIVYGIVKNSTMRYATSYWFIISLAICDIIMTIISLTHLVPATAFHDAFVEYHSIRNVVMIFFYDLFWYSAVLQLGLMAGNRFVSIVYPMEYKWIFSQGNSLIIIAMLYLLGFLASLPTLFPCCHTLWNSDFYITVYEPMDTWYKYVDMFINSLSLLLMIFSYAVIIYKVRESSRAMAKYQLTIRARHQAQLLDGRPNLSRESSLRPPRSQISKKEMRLFVQFFVVSIVFLLTWTTWQWLPYMSESKWAYFLMTSLFFINNSVNPTVYLLFNTQLRRELYYSLCRDRVVGKIQQRANATRASKPTDTSKVPLTNKEIRNGGLHSSTVSGANEEANSSPSSNSSSSGGQKEAKKYLIKGGKFIHSSDTKETSVITSHNVSFL
uniref:G-protein coupled receptors family 1 profile domain-containing protein n=1 Tax=Acrobeloides nanus TaxID=290746 RepID=A0A914C1M8_9BILA